MEQISYFTDHQKIVLKSLWLPAVIAAIIGGYVSHATHQILDAPENYAKVSAINFYLIGCLFAVILAWEQAIRKDWVRTIAIVGGYMVTHCGFQMIRAHFDHVLLGGGALFFIWNCAQIIGVCAIAGKRLFLQTGIFAGVLIHCSAYFSWEVTWLTFDGYNVLAVLHGLMVPYLIWTWLFIAENRGTSGYNELLNSKVQPITAKEYRVLFPVAAITTWVITYNVTTMIGSLYRPASPLLIFPSIVYLGLTLFAFYVALRITRNIAVSRLMTVGYQGDWLLFFHFIPVINFIVWMHCMDKKDLHTTRSENASFYLSREPSSLGAVIIIFGVVVNLYNTYQCYGYSTYGDFWAGVFMYIFIVKLGVYFYLRRGGRIAVVFLVILNFITVRAGLPSRIWGPEVFMVLSMCTLASYYYIAEVFVPALNKKDLEGLPDGYVEAYV